MVRSLLSVCGTALFLSGCIQSDIYYKADARGVFREIPDILPGHRTNRATYLINGRVFDYNFRAIGRGEVRDVGPGSTNLAPGEYKRTLYKLQEAPIFSRGHAIFGGIIRRLHNANLTIDGLKSTRDRGEETGSIKAHNRPAAVEYRRVNGRRWFVRTQFRDKERRSVTSRTYDTVIGGFLITLYVDFDTSSTLKSEWAQKCLDTLDQLVSDFRYLGWKPNQTM